MKKTIIPFIGVAIAFSLIIGYYAVSAKSIPHQREAFIAAKDSIIGELIMKGEYACCLETPCTYCIEKTPGHGEGASCHCLDDVINGVHPCGECIGEIMEGHGNPFLAPYFSRAIAEKVGVRHFSALAEMISDLYNTSIEDQVPLTP